MRFEVLRAWLLKIQVLWVVTPCRLVSHYRHFGVSAWPSTGSRDGVTTQKASAPSWFLLCQLLISDCWELLSVRIQPEACLYAVMRQAVFREPAACFGSISYGRCLFHFQNFWCLSIWRIYAFHCQHNKRSKKKSKVCPINLTLEGPCIIFCYIYTFQRDTQWSCTDCLLILRCQLYMFRTVTVHPQELLVDTVCADCGTCWYVQLVQRFSATTLCISLDCIYIYIYYRYIPSNQTHNTHYKIKPATCFGWLSYHQIFIENIKRILTDCRQRDISTFTM